VGAVGIGPQTASPAVKEGNTGLVFGEGHAFWLTAPKGWVLDNTSGVSAGLQAVFYRVGESWRDGKAFMYANTVVKASQSFGDVVAEDLERFKSRAPGLAMHEEQPVATADGKRAKVRIFEGDPWGNKEAVAYIDERTVVVVLVLTSRDAGEFASALPAFKALVGSYRFMTEKVEIRR